MGFQPITGHNDIHAHYVQIKNLNQPTTDVFGLRAEESGGNPRSTGRTCINSVYMTEEENIHHSSQ